ncbi:MAG TPA: alpha/beta hydrolase [Ktedonobacterales bacterium]|jgi:pimeloyl-ACP methyl ester carboxylesterase
MSKTIQRVEHDLEVNGINLHYATWGEFTRPRRVVLLVHGLTASSYYWNVLGPALAEQGWYAIAPDLRGRGQSAKPAHGIGIPFHMNDLLSLCDALSLPAVHLLGHSLGGLISLYLTALHPEYVRRLIIVDAGGRLPDDAMQAIAASLKRLGQVYPSLDAYLEERRAVPLHQWNPFWEEYYRSDVLTQPDGTVMSRVPKATIEEEITGNATLQVDMFMGRITAPTLLLRAELGILAPDKGQILTAEEAKRVREVISGCRAVDIANTNHYTICIAEPFVREVLGFLAEEE